MSKAVDLLLGKSNNDAQVEIERLSDQIGQPFFITIRPIDLFSIEATTEEDAIFQTLKLGIVDDFNNEELFKQRGVSSYEELMNNLFQYGELRYLAESIKQISLLNSTELESFRNESGYKDAYWLWSNKHITAPSEYFKMSFIDKQLISDFIATKEKDKVEQLKEIVESLKSFKSAEGVNAQLLLHLLQTNM